MREGFLIRKTLINESALESSLVEIPSKCRGAVMREAQEKGLWRKKGFSGGEALVKRESSEGTPMRWYYET
jgi:hypothetical protein